jgi:mono/diheme cytochrome c family protein
MKRIVAIAFASLAVASCVRSNGAEQPAKAESPSQVVRIALPRYQTNLPDAPGRDAFAVGCLSCHSASYVNMQPPLTQAKWEEVARKMVKVYAAPIAEDQVVPIAQYLVAVKESGHSDLGESLVPTPPAKQRTVKLATDESARAADAKRGETLFATNCASCHGPRGAGDGPTAKTQLPPPSDLTAHRYATDALCAAITRGVPATAMPGYPDLSDDDLRALVTFTQQLAPQSSPATEPVQVAKQLFAQNCQACHGGTGAGDGPIAATAPRPPANFRTVSPTRERALHVIAEGVPATSMQPWKSKLNDEQRGQLADYVRSLYAEGGAAR